MVGAVGVEIGFRLAFGDWKATTEGTSQSDSTPDFAVLNVTNGRAHGAGEMKTPWAHPIDQAMADWVGLNIDVPIRFYLGI